MHGAGEKTPNNRKKNATNVWNNSKKKKKSLLKKYLNKKTLREESPHIESYRCSSLYITEGKLA